MAVRSRSSTDLVFFTLCLTTASLARADITLNLEIVEEQPKGTMIINLKNAPEVVDHFGADQLKAISFRFLDPTKMDNVKQYFSIEEWTGILSFAQVLDRDDPDVCRGLERCLIVLDIAVNPTAAFTIIHVNINLLDENDNAPAFPQDRVTKSVTESASPGLLFPIVPASDPDSPSNGIVAYELTGSGPFRLKTSWAPDGSVDLGLVLMSTLDRETVDQYTLSVVAKDGGVPPRSGSVTIELAVNDENDNSPVFEKSVYRVQVWENGDIDRPLVRVRAVDTDAGDNGRVFYSFTKLSTIQYGTLFSIGRETGDVRLLQPLDHESKQSVTLGVMAKDQGVGSRPAYATVEIQVLDRNDNEPTITLETSDRPHADDVITVTENCRPDTFVVHISVRDPDADDAGRVDCVIDDESDFRLVKLYDKEYNILTRGVVDREVASEYRLRLQCYDHGEPSLTTSASVVVVVVDVNDHAPTFDQPRYDVVVDEGPARRRPIVRVVARDADADANGRVVYMLDEDAGDDFRIDPSTGLVTAVVVLDHETIPYREFHVLAADQADEPRYGRTLVTLTVRDVDDEAPTFERRKYEFSVPEGLPARSEVGVVKATDADDPPYDNFTYYLDGSQNDLRLFRIDPETGAIFTRAELDRELRDLYHLIAVARSDGPPRRGDTAQVDIHVTDRNDNPPTIVFPRYGNETIYVSNAAPVGYALTTVEATDADDGRNAELTYAISQGNENGEFRITPSGGDIIVNRPLVDYVGVTFRLVIMVQDGGTPTKISVQTLNVAVAEMNFTLAEIGDSAHGGSGAMTSSSSIAIIIGVIAGCVLISLVLIIAIVMLKRKHRKQPSTKCEQFWSENDSLDKVKDVNDVPMTVTSNANKTPISDITVAVKTDILKQTQLQIGKDDSDSGCADVSHAESQGSNEDPDGFIPKHGSEANNVGSLGHSPPQRMDSFTTWLHSESYNLNQKGNVYRVSEQNRERAAAAAAAAAGSPTSTLPKKTVRFSEQQEAITIPNGCSDDSSLPPPPPEFSHSYYGDNDAFYNEGPDDVSYDNDGSVMVVPEKSAFTTFQDGSLV